MVTIAIRTAAKDLILSIDQGTTGTRAIIFDSNGAPVTTSYRPLRQYYPKPGWVEHNPAEIWEATLGCLNDVLEQEGLGQRVAALGITNQRETALIWERQTGRPIHNAIVWQCRRTAHLCNTVRSAGHATAISDKTGLVIDAYFSATKWQWLFQEYPTARAKATHGDLLCGTIDSWLIWSLTGGKVHATDWTNASRTMLFNIHDLNWDRNLLDLFEIPATALPHPVAPSSVSGYTVAHGRLPAGLPIAGVAGDQQAALFGQCCFTPGSVKNTYGTGCFVLMNTGEKAVASESGLLTTVAAGPADKVQYALEGSVFNAGTAIQWLRDELGIVGTAEETEELANQLQDTDGVYFVPAFTGLGAPYWDMYARGAIVGLTRGSSRAHLARAALESMAYQSREVIDLMVQEASIPVTTLRVDGGAANNSFCMQFQADILDAPVQRPKVWETTALGAAYLAGLAVGLWNDIDEVAKQWQIEREFRPQMAEVQRTAMYSGWKRAVERSRNWSRE